MTTVFSSQTASGLSVARADLLTVEAGHALATDDNGGLKLILGVERGAAARGVRRFDTAASR